MASLRVFSRVSDSEWDFRKKTKEDIIRVYKFIYALL